jgi:hypothetical protein
MFDVIQGILHLTQQKDASISVFNLKTFNLCLQQINVNSDEICKFIKESSIWKQLRCKLQQTLWKYQLIYF